MIYLSISFLALGHFIPTLLVFSLLARYDFLSFNFLPWGISYPPHLFFIAYQVRFFIHFNPCPGPFHSLHGVISYPPCCIFHYLPGAIYLSISFLALGHFIPTLLDFSLLARCSFSSISFLALGYLIPSSLLARCDFLSISIPALGHFIPCMGPLHTNPVGFFITCQVWFFIHFIPCPGPSHTHTVTFFITCHITFSLPPLCNFLSISFSALGGHYFHFSHP